jgi:NAD+ kinase
MPTTHAFTSTARSRWIWRGDCVRLRRSEYKICFLHPPGYSYFAMLRQKLQWSERPKGP